MLSGSPRRRSTPATSSAFSACLGIGAALFLVGCSTNVSRFQLPGTDLALVENVYVRPLENERENARLQALVATNLLERGIGMIADEADVHQDAGSYIVDIAADWHWDLSWYLLELRVAIYEPQDNTLVAQAQSLQSSLVRQTIELVVERTMASLFNDITEPKGVKQDEN